MNVPLHGGHAHAESTIPIVGSEVLLVLVIGTVALGVVLTYAVNHYLPS